MKRGRTAAISLLLGATSLVACGDNGGSSETNETSRTSEAQGSENRIDIAAVDYNFEMPDTIQGGLVTFDYSNRGKEPHFVGFARIAEGATFDVVKAALAGPPPSPGAAPAGPPPFEDEGGLATGDPGTSTTATANLSEGKYAFYCAIPSPDGVSHAAKGMVKEITVSSGEKGTIAEGDGTLEAVDFAFDGDPTLKAGTNELRISNGGKQLHEINLVEIPSGKTIDDVVAWHRQQQGPPPAKFLSGVAIKPGEDASATFEIAEGRTYAFICAIPDFLGDFAPHITKGMHTGELRVS
ncbi:MAG TPA: hypothetical protein VHJ78_12290 [Actinomycetota bacterium]|nr:hypothetical protein [Actinomycetota bacterium]